MSQRLVTAGTIQADQDVVIWEPRIPRDGNPCVIWTHGLLDTAITGLGHDTTLPNALVDAGYTIIAPELSGPSWGNNASMGNMDAVAAFATGRGHDVTHLIGNSMGAVVVARWARLNPTAYAGMVCIIPALTIQNLFAGDFTTSINDAYGGNWAGNRLAVDPIEHTAFYQNSRMQIWYSTDDTLILPAWVLEFAAKAKIEPQSLGAVGHAGTPDAEKVIAHLEASAQQIG